MITLGDRPPWLARGWVLRFLVGAFNAFNTLNLGIQTQTWGSLLAAKGLP